MVLLLALATQAAGEPRSKTVPLQQFTQLTIDVIPDLGTRIVFPFVLDEQDDDIPFTLVSTNPIFRTDRQPKRNSFVVMVDTSKTAPSGAASLPTYYGNIFVTVAGYHITIELKTATRLNRHFSDIVFELGAQERELLIQKAIAQRAKGLEEEYKRRYEALEELAERRAISRIGVLALKQPKTTNIKEETTEAFGNDERMLLYVDRAMTYDPYTIYLFEIENKSKSQEITILDAKLIAEDGENKHQRILESGSEMPKRIMPNEKSQGVITALDAALSSKEVLKLQIVTDKGSLEATW